MLNHGFLADIDDRIALATPGPWFVEDHLSVDGISHGAPIVRDVATTGFVARMWKSHPAKRGNAEFIAHAREDVPWLLAELRQLWALEQDLLDRIGALEITAGGITRLSRRWQRHALDLEQWIAKTPGDNKRFVQGQISALRECAMALEGAIAEHHCTE